MILLSFLMIVGGLTWFSERVVTFNAWYQLKEYRLDRLRSKMNEDGTLAFLWTTGFEIPLRKPRNLVGMIVPFLFAVPIYCLSYYQPLALQLILFAGTPLWAFMAVSLVVFAINIPVRWHRQRIVARATAMLRASKVEQVVAITGSYGKTSVKEMLFSVVAGGMEARVEAHDQRPAGRSTAKSQQSPGTSPSYTPSTVIKTRANMNTDIGAAICILKDLTRNTRILIGEIGAYRAGEAGAVAQMLQPTIVIVTAFGNQHLALYGSKKNLVTAESEPLDYLQPGGVAILNYDIPEYSQLVRRLPDGVTVVTYGLDSTGHDKKSHPDYYATAIKTGPKGTAGTIHHPDGSFVISTPMLGAHSIQNLLPVVATAHQIGLPFTQIKTQLALLRPIEHKLSLHTGQKGATVISDSLNANLEGFLQAISVLRSFPIEKGAKRYIVTRGVIELGADRLTSYRKLMKAMAADESIQLLTTDRLFVTVADEISAKAVAQITLVPQLDDLRQVITEGLTDKDLVLIEGKIPSELRDWILTAPR